MVEQTFDWGACAPDGWRGTIRPVDPPDPVWVNLAYVFRPSRVGSGYTALRVLAFGLDNGEIIPAEVYEWIQVRSGEWWGRIRGVARSTNGMVSFALDGQAVPSVALRQRDPADDRPPRW
ncbi:hypothetical protein [Kutzneria buriramensis]|uniref:Uncharacterized protein n=1 Tax=Kutzneria buriramensis TaxID=1045776 RepID=A0A3E0G7W7_9PSEU|nr:hypothetical protein [Kutzneria buriramensis]REH18256.1 hypothetical protein BCF44_13611 [Kutzneria buriramensis]